MKKLVSMLLCGVLLLTGCQASTQANTSTDNGDVTQIKFWYA